MKLYLNKTSPYARLALVTAHEAGLVDRIETIWIEPWNDPPALLAANPLGKIPALETDDGVTLIESSCICDYLIARSGRSDLLPALPARVEVLQRVGLGRATMDCAFGAVIERRFNNGNETALSERWVRALTRAVTVLDGVASVRAQATGQDLGDLVIAVALDYVDFRLAEIGWRQNTKNLAPWIDRLRARPSMIATQPT